MYHNDLIGEIQEMYVNAKIRSQNIGNLLIRRLKVIPKKREILQLEVTSNRDRVLVHNFNLNQGFIFTLQSSILKPLYIHTNPYCY